MKHFFLLFFTDADADNVDERYVDGIFVRRKKPPLVGLKQMTKIKQVFIDNLTCSDLLKEDEVLRNCLTGKPLGLVSQVELFYTLMN